MICNLCEKDLPDSGFTVDKRNQRLRPRCRVCQAKASSAHYYANRDRYIAEKGIFKKKTRTERRVWMLNLKRGLKCECGESHPATLDFHHVDKDTKVLEIANAVGKGWSEARILAEIAKCRVLCSNCHRKEHFEERERGPDLG